MPGEVDVILLAIRAAIRINAQFRHAYADSTRSRALTLPLPDFPIQEDLSTVQSYFRLGAGQDLFAADIRLQTLLNKPGPLPAQEEAEVFQIYRDHKALRRAESGQFISTDPGKNPAGLTNEDLIPLLTIRQWQEGRDPHPTLLRRMAGTFVNIAVDFAVEVPGVLSPESPRGRVLRSLLTPFQDIDFAEDGSREILEGMFVAALEMLRDNPEVVSQDARARDLVQAVAKGLHDDARNFLAGTGLTLSGVERVRGWSQLVFRSVLQSASATVFADPQKYLGISGAGQAELISNIGRAVFDSVLTTNAVDLPALFTPQSLDHVMKAALLAVSHHPSLVAGGNAFLKELVAATAGDLAQAAAPFGPQLIPEAIRLVLVHTAGNLELLMPDGVNQPHEHLLLVATREFLTQLSQPAPAGATWKPVFTAQDFTRLLEVVMDEVVQNPEWLVQQVGTVNTLLREVTREVIQTLQKIGGPRLRKGTGLRVLEAALRACGRRLEFTAPAQNRRLIGLAVEAALAGIFRPGAEAAAAWALARDAALERLVQLLLAKLERAGPSEDNITKAKTAIEKITQQIAKGGPWSWEELEKQFDLALA